MGHLKILSQLSFNSNLKPGCSFQTFQVPVDRMTNGTQSQHSCIWNRSTRHDNRDTNVWISFLCDDWKTYAILEHITLLDTLAVLIGRHGSRTQTESNLNFRGVRLDNCILKAGCANHRYETSYALTVHIIRLSNSLESGWREYVNWMNFCVLLSAYMNLHSLSESCARAESCSDTTRLTCQASTFDYVS